MRPALLVMAMVGVAVAALVVWWLAREVHSPGPRDESAAQAEERREPEAAATREPAIAIKPRPFDPAQDPAAPETAATVDPNAFAVIGKVIDERRKPVPKASIEAVIDGRPPLAGKTGADGRFRIAVGPRPKSGALRGAVLAADDRGRVALASLPEDPATGNEIDAGVLSLGEGAPLSVRVIRDGQAVAGARVWFGSTLQDLGLGPFAADAQGLVGPRKLPHGSYLVRALSEDLAFRGEARADVPRRDGGPLDVVLAPAWRLTVTVKDGVTGQPVAGVRLDLTSTIKTGDVGMMSVRPTLPEPIAPTDAEGRSRIVGLSPERGVTVQIVPAEGFRGAMRFMQSDTARAHAKPGTEEVVLTMGGGGETFRFPIVADETEGPPDGAEVSLSVPAGFGSATPPPKGKVVGRDLVIDHLTDRHVNILATAADGSTAIVRILGDARKTKIGSEAKFRKPRAVTVTARDSKGNPLAGYLVQCRNPGNIPIGNEVATGADGSARIEGLPAQRLDVTIRGTTENLWQARVGGVVDLTKPGDGRLDLVLERERRCVMRVTVDGEKRLPPTISVRVATERGVTMAGGIGPLEEDPEQAILRFNFRPDPKQKDAKLSVSGKGCPSTTVPFRLPSDDEEIIELDAALVTGATIRIHVVPPADNIHDVGVESYDDATSSWFPRGYRGPDSDEIGKKPTELAFDALPAGRYRARDAMTGLVGDPVDVATGASADLTLDLSRAGTINGRVEGPADVKDIATVIVDGAGLSRGGMGPIADRGIQVQLNKEFTARVPGDRPVTLRVKHPFLAPAPEGGTATVKEAGASVVLKLVRGAEVRFRLSGPDRGTTDGTNFDSERVLLFSGKVESEPVQTCTIRFQEGVGTFAGFKPGKYTLWFDLKTGAPLVVEDADLSEGSTDLGKLELSDGAAVRVKIQVAEGKEFPRLNVSARPVAKPDYSRSGYSASSGEAVVRGLGPGRFKISIHAGDFRSKPQEQEVESTGSGEIPLAIDLR